MKMGTIAATIAGSISNGGGLVVVNADGSVSVTPATGTGVLLGVAPPATNRYALMQIGSGPTDGVTAGHYVGSANGGGYGANFASGYTGDLLRLQIAGADKLFVDKLGNVAFASGSSLTSGGAALSGISNGWQASSGSDISVLLVRTAGTGNTTPVLVARGGPSQVGDVFQMQNNTPTALAGIRADGLVYSTAALATSVKAGAPTDADFATTPPDGTTKGDSTNSKFWIRLGGVWKGVVVA